MKSKAKEVVKWIYKHTNITFVCRKSAGKEVLSFSSLFRLCGVTSTECASLRESELFSHSSVCYPNLMSYSPEPSSFLPSFLQFHWLPKDSLNIFVRERARSGLVGSKWLNAVIPTRFTLCENGLGSIGFQMDWQWSLKQNWGFPLGTNGPMSGLTSAPEHSFIHSHTPHLFNLNIKFQCKHLKGNLNPAKVLIPKWTNLFTHLFAHLMAI